MQCHAEGAVRKEEELSLRDGQVATFGTRVVRVEEVVGAVEICVRRQWARVEAGESEEQEEVIWVGSVEKGEGSRSPGGTGLLRTAAVARLCPGGRGA